MKNVRDIPLRCSCGLMRATLHDIYPGRANRNVCCCKGCQDYAHALGRAAEILDMDGGTDVFQVSPARFEFIKGREWLACMQLTPKGALRFYANCCQTPIAHTLPTRSVPFMAINPNCVDYESLGVPLEEVVGPVRATVNGTFSRARAKEIKGTALSLVAMALRVLRLTIGWVARGDHKRSPFFDQETGQPIVKPPQLALERQIKRRKLHRVGCG